MTVVTVPDLLRTLARTDSASPRLTWYGADGERVELSGRVLENWVHKAANVLVEEGDCQAGDTVRLDLPSGHWRATYWALAAWLCGASVRLDEVDGSDVLVTADADTAADSAAPLRILVSLPALARSFPGQTPGGVMDEAAELASYGDHFVADAGAIPAGSSLALVGADGATWNAGALFEPDTTVGARRHVDAATAGAAACLRAQLSTWASTGSVVVTSGGSLEALERTLAAEGVDW